jgi:hypothetical protein
MTDINKLNLLQTLYKVYADVNKLTGALVPYESQLKKLGFPPLAEMPIEQRLAAANFIKRIAEEAQG